MLSPKKIMSIRPRSAMRRDLLEELRSGKSVRPRSPAAASGPPVRRGQVERELDLGFHGWVSVDAAIGRLEAARAPGAMTAAVTGKPAS